MRTIGIDLALTAAHKAVVADAQGRFLTPVWYLPWPSAPVAPHSQSSYLSILVMEAAQNWEADDSALGV